MNRRTLVPYCLYSSILQILGLGLKVSVAAIGVQNTSSLFSNENICCLICVGYNFVLVKNMSMENIECMSGLLSATSFVFGSMSRYML